MTSTSFSAPGFPALDLAPFAICEPWQNSREFGFECAEGNGNKFRQRGLEHVDESLDLGGVDFLFASIHRHRPRTHAIAAAISTPSASTSTPTTSTSSSTSIIA